VPLGGLFLCLQIVLSIFRNLNLLFRGSTPKNKEVSS